MEHNGHGAIEHGPDGRSVSAPPALSLVDWESQILCDAKMPEGKELVVSCLVMFMIMQVASDPFTPPHPPTPTPPLAACRSLLQMVRTQPQLGPLVLRGVPHL